MKRLVCGLFLVLSVLHTWPLITVLPSQIRDDHDAILNVWTLGAIAQQLARDPLHPLDVNMFYPFDDSLATLDPQLANGTLAAPVTWVSGNPVLGHNVFILATFVLSGLTMFLLVRELTGSVAAGLIAGCLYAFSPFRTNRLSHSHMLAGFWLPLMLLWIHRYVAEPRWGRLLAVVALFVAQALSSWYFAAMGLVAALVVGIWSLAAHGNARIVVTRAVGGGLLVFFLLAPFALPFARVKAWEVSEGPRDLQHEQVVAPLLERIQRLFDRQLDIGGRAKTSAELQHYLGVGPDARLWTSLRRFGFVEGSYFAGAVGLALALLGCAAGGSRRMSVGLPGPGEVAPPPKWSASGGASLPLCLIAAVPAAAILCAALGQPDAWPVIVTRRGSLVVVTLLSVALWSFWHIRRDSASRTNTIMRTYVALMVAGVLLSLGPQVRAFGVDLGASLYPSFVPPFGVLRVPARFGVLYTVGIAVLAGLGTSWMERRIQLRARSVALAGALLVINLEHAVAPMKFVPVPRVTPFNTWLKHAPAGAVVVFPTHNNPWALVNSLFHRHPIVNGAGLVAPPPYVRLNARDDLSPAMIEHLRTYFHPRYVVLNLDLYPREAMPDVSRIMEESRDDLRLAAQMGGTRIFELQPGGRGPALRRWYPPSLLKGKAGVAFRGRIEGGRQDMDVTVTAASEDGVLASWSDQTFLQDVLQFAPFKGVFRRAMTVEVAVDYRIRTDTARPLIGLTGVPAPVDASVTATLNRTAITVNNRSWSAQKGYTLVTVAPADQRTEVRNFNTSWYESDSQKLADYIAALEPGRIVVIASNYDVSRQLTADAVRALGTLGFKEDLRGRLHSAHGGVGVKGAAPGTAIECVGPTSTGCGVGSPAALRLNLRELRLY